MRRRAAASVDFSPARRASERRPSATTRSAGRRLLLCLALASLFTVAILAPLSSSALGGAGSSATVPVAEKPAQRELNASSTNDSTTVPIIASDPTGTVRCVLATAATQRDRDQNLSLEFGNLSSALGDLSNSSVGDLQLCVEGQQGPVTAEIDFSQAAVADSGRTVLGYPDVNYGVCPWGAADPPAQDTRLLSLPVQLRNGTSPTIWPDATFSLAAESVPVDLAYDIWLTPDAPKVTAQSECHADQHYLEVMLWLSHAGTLAPAQSANLSATAEQFPTSVNGQLNPATPWTGYVYCNGDVGATVTYVLGSDPSSGTIAMDLQAVLENAVGLGASCPVAQQSGTNLSAFWLDEIDLGSEFAPGASHSPEYAWQISAYCLLTGSLSPLSEVTSCGGSDANVPSSSPPSSAGALTEGDFLALGAALASASVVLFRKSLLLAR